MKKGVGKDRVMLAVALEDLKTQKVLVAVSMHLMKRPKLRVFENMRVQETLQVLMQMRNFLADLPEGSEADAIIVMGDFNAEPDSYTVRGLLRLSGESAGPDGNIKGTLPQLSLFDTFEEYRQQRAAEGKAACTSKTEARNVWIDYIMASTHYLKVKEVKQVQQTFVEDCDELRKARAVIPDKDHPSDHLPIYADIEWLPETE